MNRTERIAGMVRELHAAMVTAALLVTAACAGASAQTHQQVQAQIDHHTDDPSAAAAAAQSQLDHGDAAAAEKTLRAYLAGHPGDAASLYELGSVLEREDRPKESLAVYTEAAKTAAPRPEDLRIVALDYVLLEDYADAIHWLQRALAGNPDNAEAWYDLGRCYMMENNFPQAQAALRRSLALIRMPAGSARAVKAENNLGVTLEGLGRTEEAAAAYRTAIEWQKDLLPQSEQPLLNYGKLLLQQNRAKEAVAELEAAVKLAPSNANCREQLARALNLDSGNDAALQNRAQAEMREAIRLDPSNPRLHFQLGLMYRRAGKMEQAREEMALSGKLYGSHSTPADR